MNAVQSSFPFTAPTNESQRRNLVIEAGAGTGKTTTIAAKVIKLMIENPDLAPERIVLMTFTEKAAGEIADRIRSGLEHLHATVDEDRAVWPPKSSTPLVVIDAANRERAKLALTRHLPRIDALRSQTIHSFCQSLLRTFPIEAGLDPQFKIVEGFERALLYSQLYDAWVDEETRANPLEEHVRQWELLFGHCGYLFLVRDLILSLAGRRDLLQETGYDFGSVSDVDADIREHISIVRRTDEISGDEDAMRIFAHLREVDPPAVDLPEEEALDAWIAYFEPIAQAMLDADLPKKHLKDVLRFLRTDEKKGTSIHKVLSSHRAAMAAVAMTRRFLDYVDAEKRRLGVVDFDDLLLRTLAVLGDESVLKRARAQFDSFFVDEFQDTDRVQARIVEALAKDESERFVPGRIVVVGDPKQSIYGFRRADPETYDQMTRALAAGGADEQLIIDQYRSDPPLLDAVNALFECVFPRERDNDRNVFRPKYHRLNAARPEAAREVDARFTLLRASSDDAADRYFSEATAIAEWIKARRDGSGSDLQRYAILFRRLTELDDYLDTLDRYDIEYVLPPTRLFLDRRAPVDLLAVLRAIAFPHDRGALVSAARTPYFGLTDDEIASGVLGVTTEPWGTFVDTIARFREASRQLTVSGLIDLVVETSAIEQLYAAAAEGTRHLRHLAHVRRIAFDYDARSGGSVRQFVDEIIARRDDPDEMEPSPADESRNALRILTVHAAKGLEFDTVIIPDLGFDTRSGDGGVQFHTVEEPKSLVLSGRVESISARFRKAGNDPLRKIASQRQEAEMRRLFYVAVTRAKSEVVFVCNIGEKTSMKGFLKCLLEPLALKPAALDAMWPEEGERVVQELSVGGTPIPVALESIAARGAERGSRPRLREGELEAALAASAIVPATIDSPALPELLTAGEIAARRAGSRSRAAGILLHRVLELWDGTSDPETLIRSAASESAADAEIVERVRRRMATVSRSATLLRMRGAETVGREVAVRFRDDGGAVVERRIDRLLREEGRELVVDYKSGTPDATRLAKDRDQVARYCRAIAAITGRECRGLLWYIDLERDVAVDVSA